MGLSGNWLARLATRRRTRGVLVVLLLLAIAAAVDWTLMRERLVWNQRIVTATVPSDLAADAPPPARFALAYAMAASGAEDAALARYRSLQTVDAPIGPSARYNTANVLMRQAIRLKAGPQPGQAIPLIELAKENYREVLRRDPAHWDARYNLERAQRLLPDPEESDAPPAEAPKGAERAATTMRGVSQGLP